MNSILIISGGLQAISIAHAAKQCGCMVYVLASKQEAIRHSSWVDQFTSTIPQRTLEDQVLELISRSQIDLLIPMSDTAAQMLNSSTKDAIKCRCITPNTHSFNTAANKELLMQLCEQYNFPHPRTISITSDNIYTAVETVHFPALIKPNHSVGARGITLVNSIGDLNQHLNHILANYGDATLQEYIDCKHQPYYNVMLYRSKSGDILGNVVIEIIRYVPISGGSSSLCRTVENSELISICSAVLEKLDWKGIADFDVLKDKDGSYKIIEINPRVPASVRAADIAGVNFVEIMLNDLYNQPQQKYAYHTNMYLRYFGLDIVWFLQSPYRWTTRPNWFASIGKHFYYQDIYRDDPSTWFTWLSTGVKHFFEKRKNIFNL